MNNGTVNPAKGQQSRVLAWLDSG